MKKTVLIFAITALLFAAPAWAHGDDHEQHHDIAVPMAGSDVKALEDGFDALQTAAAAKEYGKIHKIVESMEPALKSLGEAHEHDAGITGTAAHLSKVLHDLHEAGDAKDADATAAELKKFDGGLQLLKARLRSETSK